MILALRTDKPEAEAYLYDGPEAKTASDSLKWQAHRELSDTLLIKIEQLLDRNGLKKEDLQGIIIFQGPGSFTGLRIGITVANSLAYSLNISIATAQGNDWQVSALSSLAGKSGYSLGVSPHYGSEARITQPRK